MKKPKSLSFFSKKIIVSIVLILMVISLFSLADNVSANTIIWFSQQNLTVDSIFYNAVGVGALAGNNQFLVSASFYFDVVNEGGNLTAYLALSNNVNSTNNPVTGVSWIQHSNTINLDATTVSFINNNHWLQFNFPDNYNLSSSLQYDIYVVNNGGTLKFRNGASSASQIIYQSGAWNSGGGNAPTCLILTESDIQPISTPQPNSGSVAVKFFVNNGTSTYDIPLQEGNLTWGLLISGSTSIPMFIGNSGATIYFNDGNTLLLKPSLASGWYFTNFTLSTDTTIDNFTYQIDNWAFTLNSGRNLVYNFTMYISQTPNSRSITLNDVAHGSIYFQTCNNSVPTGVKYGANTYNIAYGTVLYISTLPDSGYKTDYFTIQNSGISSIVSGNYLTFIVTSDTTITPHYVISSSTGVTGGTGSIWSFLSGFTWQYIAVLVIYTLLCGLCTYLFAFTGLLAGLNIATVICFLMGLLGSLMYPVLGLVIIADITLIIMGSGLLNRTKKDSGN